MRIGLIDLGTTALRFEVYEVCCDTYRKDPHAKHLRQITRTRLMPRLGDGLYETGRLNELGRSMTLEFFRRLPEQITLHCIDSICVAATSAFREATDGPSFVRELETISGISIQILQGDEEAALTAQGIVTNDPQCRGRQLLVDIGGGSTEFSLCEEGKILCSSSAPLGAIRDTQGLVLPERNRALAPNKSAIESLKAHCRDVLTEHLDTLSCVEILGSSGTVRSLFKLEPSNRKRHDALSAGELTKLTAVLCSSDFNTRCSIEGMEENRADIIVAGALILEAIVMHTKAERILQSVFSLRHGLLHRAILAA